MILLRDIFSPQIVANHKQYCLFIILNNVVKKKKYI